jgi:hypothetical protein
MEEQIKGFVNAMVGRVYSNAENDEAALQK